MGSPEASRFGRRHAIVDCATGEQREAVLTDEELTAWRNHVDAQWAGPWAGIAAVAELALIAAEAEANPAYAALARRLGVVLPEIR